MVHPTKWSPSDIVLGVIEGLRPDLKVDDIGISGKDWRRVPGDIGEPQSVIDPDIVRTDLLILVIGHRIGERGRERNSNLAGSFMPRGGCSR